MPRAVDLRVRTRRTTALVVAGVLAAALVAVPPTVAAGAGPVSTVDALTPFRSAAGQAKAAGHAVEVVSETTETSQVLARPDGKYELTSQREAVRVRRGSGWVPVDTTLHTLPGGALAPVASAADVTFSGGGTGAMVRIGAQGGGAVEFHWPDPLPAPELSGDTATYRDVLPGVDLQLIALAESYREVLVVHDARAAANPRVRKLGITTVADGLTLRTSPEGRISAQNTKGEEVLTAPVPTMWDSTVDSKMGGAPSARTAGSGKVTRLGVNQVTANGIGGRAAAALELTPPATALDAPDVRYPVYIDPAMQGGRGHYLTVQSGGWNYYDDADEPMRVGYCNFSECTSSNGVGRSYFSLATSALTGKPTTAHVYTAEVYVYQIHQGAGCGQPQPTDLWSANPFGSSTTFGGPRVTKLDTDAKDFGDQCGTGGDLVFNSASVLAYVQGAATGDKPGLNFGLSAPDEDNRNQWKKFTNKPILHATFDFPPSVPTGLDVAANVACPGKPNYVRDTTPTVYASAVDNDPDPTNVGLHFEIHNSPSNGNAQRYNTTAVAAASGTKAAWTTNAANSNIKAGLTPGNYALRVKASSLSPDTADQFSGFSPWYYFSIDYAPPTSVPTIASFDYPNNYWGAPQNAPGVLTLNGSTDTAAFTYSFDTSGGEPLPTDTMCAYTTTPTTAGGMITAADGKANVTVPSTLLPGYHTMYVKAFDEAHNVTAQSAGYVFYVSPIFAGTGVTQIEGESITPAQPEGQGDPGYNNGHGYPVYVEYPSKTPLSGDKQSYLAITGGTPDAPARFDYRFNVSLNAYYALGLQITTQNHHGILAFELDGTPVRLNGSEVVVDGYSPTKASKYVPLGGARLLPGPHTITLKVIGASASSVDYVYNGTYGAITISNLHDHGHSAAVDFFTVVPINNVTYGSLADALNNDGVGSDGVVADIGPSASNSALSLQALAAKGYVPGSLTPPIGADGLRFQLPGQGPKSVDNVMASGQTIGLPTAATANFVNLLVASSCGPSPTGANIQLSMNHVNPANPDGELLITDTMISSVPDWKSGPTSVNDPQVTLAATFDHYNQGTTQHTDVQSKLYRLKVPVKPGYEAMPIRSVTLPSLGTNFTESCTTPGLHVFAVATSQ
jgi:hypothetical protein